MAITSPNPLTLGQVMANEGETVDGLIWRAAGLGPESLPAVLAVNPGLCDTIVLPARSVVFLPPEPLSPPTRTIIQLWS